MGSKKALGKARRAWEDKIKGPRYAASSVLDYAIPTHDAIQFLRQSGHPDYDRYENDQVVQRALFGTFKWIDGHQTTYDVDRDLLAALLNSDLPDGAIPADVLRHLPHGAALFALPEPIVVNDDAYVGFIPFVSSVKSVVGGFDLGFSDALSIIWFGYNVDNPSDSTASTQSIVLTDQLRFEDCQKMIMGESSPEMSTDGSNPYRIMGVLEDGEQHFVDEARKKFMSSSAIPADWNEVTATLFPIAVNLLLYVCSTEVDAQAVVAPREVGSTRMARTGKPLTLYALGWRIGAAMRSAKSQDSLRNAHQGGTRAPHVRRGHWHRYWTGPRDGDRKIVVRWVPPIEVNASKGPIVPTVRLLR